MPDQVSIQMASGYNLITLPDWFGMSLQERISLVTGGKVQFLKAGEPMALRDALEAIKNAA
tara:strand:- start:235 stop:417 length:183 start_codon:yes stop_codon:yes gene_type:complete